MVKFSESEESASVLFEKTHNTIINAIRRTILDEVPTFAIEDVEVVENGSPLYDETIAQRLGLVPIKTDLKSYNLKEECSCGGVGCAMCEVKMNLIQDSPGYVYSGSIKSDDPHIVPFDNELPITKLFFDNKINLNLKAVLNRGKVHSKWSPAHTYLREIDSKKDNKKDGKKNKKNDINSVELVIEPFGQLNAKDIYNKAIDILIDKTTELEKQL